MGSPSKEYIYSGSALLATIAGSTTTYHHADHLSVRLTSDTSGTKIGEQAHYPFGESWYANSTTTKWQFTSYERDPESGNDYAMFRSYVNRLGRFSSPDPIAGFLANPQSLNRYAYVRNDPNNFADPFGLDGYCIGDRCYVDVNDIPGVKVTISNNLWLFWMFGGGSGGRIYAPLLDGTENERGGDPPGDKKKRDMINAALKQKNLAKCLNKFFGPGTILTNDNLPHIDASQDLPGARAGQTDANRVPETGRGTVEIDRGLFNGLPANDPFLVGTYLHETANVLAIQRFTSIQPRGARAFRGPSGGPPTEAQRNDRVDQDIGQQFEKCIFGKE